MTKFQIGSGKSDSFFFYTANSQFIIKTLKEAELKLLVKKGVLEKYFQHLKKNKDSMLARFYGVYNVKIKYMKPISVVIMDNLMSEHVNEILRIYDLKGSLHKRITARPKNNKSVRKDLNFLLDNEFVIKLSEEQKQEFVRRLEKDKEFLKSCHLMDYSLLLIFFKKNHWDETLQSHIPMRAQESLGTSREMAFSNSRINLNDQNIRDDDINPIMEEEEEFEEQDQDQVGPSRHVDSFRQEQSPLKPSEIVAITIQDQVCTPPASQRYPIIIEDTTDFRVNEFVQARDIQDPLCYYRFGIIDFLQDYTKKKKLETVYLRRRFNKKDPNCFSCVDPNTYGDRFYEFLRQNLFIGNRVFPEGERSLSDKERRTQGSAGKIGEDPSSTGARTGSASRKWMWFKNTSKSTAV
ncbi:hypothetical protein FGO68_gene3536 [Halteria grandinella]|uniref:PIPK domain-containing protein n=1 Tax=Halteria grandinella TaxID=5974 RepID=A0A8J8NES8_HALGN|nr:hypothetical protein FGO68_gene3536 [Halteria grandinella]